MIKKHGGNIFYTGPVIKELVGNPKEKWDMVAIIEYPSAEAFVSMAFSKEYIEIKHLREKGLENTRLITLSPKSKL